MLSLAAPLLLIAHPASQHAQPNPEWDCDEPTQQQEMNWCAAEEYRSADAALNRQWAKTTTQMRARDKDWATGSQTDTRPGWYDTLIEAQRAWLTFRDAHCRADGYYARGGSLEPLLVSTCKTALTKARTEQLRELAENP